MKLEKSVGFQEAGARRVPRRDCALSVNTPLGYIESGLFVRVDSMVGGFCSSVTLKACKAALGASSSRCGRGVLGRRRRLKSRSADYLARAMTMRPSSLSVRAVQWCSKAIIRVRRAGRQSGEDNTGVAEGAKNARRNDSRE